jgi:hypothetical protein
MRNQRPFELNWRLVAAAGAAAVFIAGCNNNNTTTVPEPNPPPSSTVSFTIFAETAFANSANSTPVAINDVTFNFDSNDDPTAFNNLIAEGSF